MIRTITALALGFVLGSLTHAAATEFASPNHRTVYHTTPEGLD